MFIDPAISIAPSYGRSMSAATFDRAPSAPIRYLARIAYCCPVTRSSTVTVTPSASWVCDRYSVENRVCVPRSRGVPDQDRLKVGLRDVHDQARRRELIVRLTIRPRTPRADAADLLPRDARAEHGVADQRVLGRVGQHLLLDAEVAEDLHRTLIGDVRPRRVRRPPILGDHDVRMPRLDSSSAAVAPAGPEPTTTTSVVTTAPDGSSVSASPSLNSGTAVTSQAVVIGSARSVSVRDPATAPHVARLGGNRNEVADSTERTGRT